MQLLPLVLLALCATSCAADTPPPFNKAELEAVLRKDHSQRISNIYDSESGIQYTWDIENQELCPGVDGKCSKDEL
ncbi:hypothetical protein AB1Y20_015517 [Prymnesium parvum]|uniref:Uncharacterized protein n=1 Tax=Prymnesium parvum TaxID=97485 RepID=A0AB34K1N9_PRYPA